MFPESPSAHQDLDGFLMVLPFDGSEPFPLDFRGLSTMENSEDPPLLCLPNGLLGLLDLSCSLQTGRKRASKHTKSGGEEEEE
jgi:hypothetical protein